MTSFEKMYDINCNFLKKCDSLTPDYFERLFRDNCRTLRISSEVYFIRERRYGVKVYGFYPLCEEMVSEEPSICNWFDIITNLNNLLYNIIGGPNGNITNDLILIKISQHYLKRHPITIMEMNGTYFVKFGESYWSMILHVTTTNPLDECPFEYPEGEYPKKVSKEVAIYVIMKFNLIKLLSRQYFF